MTMPKTPSYARPGHPEGPWWSPIVMLGVLFVAAVAGWVILAGVVWLVWAYTPVVGSIVVALAVAGELRVALKHGWRPWPVAAVLLLAVLVGWVAFR